MQLVNFWGRGVCNFRDNDIYKITKTFLVRVGMAFYFTHNQVLVWHTLPHRNWKKYIEGSQCKTRLIYRDTIISYLRSHLYLYYIYLYISFNNFFSRVPYHERRYQSPQKRARYKNAKNGPKVIVPKNFHF